jgi:CheY-like chemotaxis protein
MRILVADDEDTDRTKVAKALRSEGHTVLEAENANELLRLLEADPSIDLVLADVIMPGPTGADLADAIHLAAPSRQDEHRHRAHRQLPGRLEGGCARWPAAR